MSQLTISGEEANENIIKRLNQLGSTKKSLEDRIVALFSSSGCPGSLTGFDYSHTSARGINEILDILHLLPIDHPVVDLILDKANLILERVSKMSVLDVFTDIYRLDRTSPDRDEINVFDVGDAYHPDAIYPHIKTAAYNILNLHVRDTQKFPNNHLVDAAVCGMIGYSYEGCKSKHNEVIDFLDVLKSNKTQYPYMLRAYARLGQKTEAIAAFIEAVQNNFQDIAFDSIGLSIRRLLIKQHNFTDDDIKEEINALSRGKLKDRILAYFFWRDI